MVVSCSTQKLITTSKNISLFKRVQLSNSASSNVWNRCSKNESISGGKRGFRLYGEKHFHTSNTNYAGMPKLSPQEVSYNTNICSLFSYFITSFSLFLIM